MKKLIHQLSLAFLLLFSLFSSAQEKQINRADKQYDRYAYIDAISIYERVANKGYHSAELLQNLGNAYYFNGKLEEANHWYAALFALTSEVSSEYYYRFAQTLKSVGDYTQADLYLAQFAQRDAADSRAKLAVSNADYLAQIKANSGRYNLDLLPINSAYSDYGSTVYNNQLVFASARDTGSVSKKIHSWTNAHFTSLYQSELLADGNWGKPQKFAGKLRTKFNESTPVFSADGQTIYFTRNNYNKGKRGKDAQKTTLLKIYSAKLNNEKWSDAEELPFNSDQYSTAHPALSADGKWLYFASDRQGGLGQSDLYRVEVLSEGGFGTPIHLGSQINTSGRESFPFVSTTNELYFSSDGHPGLGGLDIFVAKINPDGSLGQVQNIGAPANSSQDDFAYYIDGQTRRGFLSSNRKDGVGNDDIYSFTETTALALDCKQTVSGIVYDLKTNEKLAHATITLYDAQFKVLGTFTTQANGSYELSDLACGTRYRIKAELQGYNTAEVAIDLPLQSGHTQVDFGLEKTKVKVEKGDDLFKVLKLEPIYFDFDKSNIRPDAALELAKVVEVLRDYPQMKIDVRSHTDSRGNDAYNLKLSDRRAKSTIAWIVEQGIDSKRVSGKGYGETQLINGCGNASKCSEQAHQENRRSEFIVLDL